MFFRSLISLNLIFFIGYNPKFTKAEAKNNFCNFNYIFDYFFKFSIKSNYKCIIIGNNVINV